MAKKTKEVAPEFDAVLLKEVVDGTLKDGFLYANPGSLAPLAAAEMVEVNSEFVDADGNVGARATQKGIDFINGAPGKVIEALPAFPEKTGFGEYHIAEVPFPGSRRTGRAAKSVYPFDELEVGKSFFIPAEDGQSAADVQKKYASTVSSATARFAVPVEGETREKKTLRKHAQDTPLFDADAVRVGVGKAGDPILDADGKKTYEIEIVQKTVPTRQFAIRAVADSAPWGKPGVAGAGVWRLK